MGLDLIKTVVTGSSPSVDSSDVKCGGNAWFRKHKSQIKVRTRPQSHSYKNYCISLLATEPPYAKDWLRFSPGYQCTVSRVREEVWKFWRLDRNSGP